jgi:hypothetical protein
LKYIIITASIVGKTIQYEKLGKRGQKRMVPKYFAELIDDTDWTSRFTFAVTRDSALIVFGKRKIRYRKGGECPPNRTCTPYLGKIVYPKRNGFSLRLYESWCQRQCSLTGTGPIIRQHILIHAGPASGLGCMSVAGGRRGFACFKKALKNILNEDEEIFVFIEPRPKEHHTNHLIR